MTLIYIIVGAVAGILCLLGVIAAGVCWYGRSQSTSQREGLPYDPSSRNNNVGLQTLESSGEFGYAGQGYGSQATGSELGYGASQAYGTEMEPSTSGYQELQKSDQSFTTGTLDSKSVGDMVYGDLNDVTQSQKAAY